MIWISRKIKTRSFFGKKIIFVSVSRMYSLLADQIDFYQSWFVTTFWNFCKAFKSKFCLRFNWTFRVLSEKFRICVSDSVLEQKYSQLCTLTDECIHTARFSVLRFGLYSPKHMFYRKIALISIKALICGYFEPKKLRTRPPNKAVTSL